MNHPKYPAMKDTVRIKKMSGFCWIEELLYDKGADALPLEAFILSLCNGDYDISIIEHIMSEVFHMDEEKARETVSKTLERFRIYIEYFDAPTEIKKRYLPESFLYRPLKRENDPLGRFETPASVVLPLTRRCNFRCIYCYNSSGEAIPEELTTEQWIDVVYQLKELDVIKCTLTGGEPMVHPGFFEILSELMRNDILTYICTNGSLLDEEAILKLKDLNVPMVQISLDSSSPEEHDAMTCSHNTFDKIIHAVERLVGLGIKVYVKSLIMPRNTHNILNLIDLCYNLGVSNLILDRFDLSYTGRGDNSFFIDRESEKRLTDLVNTKKESVKGMNVNFIAGPRNWESKDDIVACGAFRRSFSMLPDGSYAVCEKLDHVPEMCIGNFKTMSIKEMWNSKRIEEILLPPKERYAEPCRSCEYLDICKSGCFAAKRFVTDDFYAPDPKCFRAEYKNNQSIAE